MISYATKDDEEELYHAMLRTPAWHSFLNRVVQPEIVRLRKNALTNAGLGKHGHSVVVKQLAILRETVTTAYTIVGEEVPKELLTWFE